MLPPHNLQMECCVYVYERLQCKSETVCLHSRFNRVTFHVPRTILPTMTGSRWGRAINKYIEQGAWGVRLHQSKTPSLPHAVIDLKPITRQALFTFANQADIDQWEVFTDQTLGIGGTSTADLAQCPDHEVGQHMLHTPSTQ